MKQCDACELPAVIAYNIGTEEDVFVYACWEHGLDAMVFTDGKNHYCDVLDEVPWLEEA